MGYGVDSRTRYREIPRYETANYRTGDAMNIQLMIVLMAGSLAAMLLMLAFMRSKKRKEAFETGTIEATQDQPKRKRFRKSSLLSLLLVGLIAGVGLQPAPVSAAVPAGQVTFFAVEEGFTYDQLMAWFDWLVYDEGLLTEAQRDAIIPTIQLGDRLDLVVEHVSAVEKTVTTNDVDALDLDVEFDPLAKDLWVESSTGSLEPTNRINPVTLNEEVKLTEFMNWKTGKTGPPINWAAKTACWERVLANGGVAFEKTSNGRPSLYTDTYTATVLYRGYEVVEGYKSFSAVTGDLLISDILRTYMTFIPGMTTAGAGAGATVIPPGETPLAPPGEAVIPPADTPLAGPATIGDNTTPKDSGTGTDAGAIGALPWWAWVLIAAVIVIAVVLITRGVNRRKQLAEEEE